MLHFDLICYSKWEAPQVLFYNWRIVMLWTEDTRQYKTSAFCSKYRAASHLAANFPNFPGEVAAACEIRGGEDDGWGRLLTVAGVTSPRRRQPTLYNFTHWLGRRQIRAKYFQKVVKGSVTELSCSVDCIRCVTDLPPPRPPQHSQTIVRGDQAAKIQRTLQQIMLQFVFPPHSFTLIMFLNIHFHNIWYI